ncbi:MAG: nuclear transport factor 2 family protein [Nakamurella sp.]
MTSAQALQRFAETIDSQDWDGLTALLAPGFAGRYVHDGQIFDRDGLVAFNRDYPGNWRFQWEEVLEAGNSAVGRAKVSGNGQTFYVASFIAVDDSGLISELTEVWTDAVTAPTRD